MNNYKLNIQYDGNRYKGWQRLGDDSQTVQGKIENVLKELLGRKVEIIGCSRTDAGVHALDQVANFQIRESYDPLELKQYLNRYLPDDICITAVTPVLNQFHARYNAGPKTYLYKIWNKDHVDPFIRKYSLHITGKLDLEQMTIASNYFIGEHDFTAFTNAKSKKKSMVREIYSIEMKELEGLIEIRISGNGFLHNMVRKIVGTLIEVGLGNLHHEEVPRIIETKKRNLTGPTADSHGLFLENIQY